MEPQDLSKRYERLEERLKEVVKDPEFTSGVRDVESYVKDVLSEAQDDINKIAKYKSRGKQVSSEIIEGIANMQYNELEIWKLFENKWAKDITGKTERKEYLEQVKIAFYDRSLGILEERFGVTVESRKKIKGKISITDKFIREMEKNPEIAKYVAQLVHGNEIDFADMIAVILDGKMQRTDIATFIGDQRIRQYIGGTSDKDKKDGVTYGPKDILEAGIHLLPLDKGGVIADIIYKRLIDDRRENLGPKPTLEQKTAYLEGLRKAKAVLYKNEN